MNETLEFGRATKADMQRIVEIIRQAQARMRAAGSLQWQDGYPAAPDIARDIVRGYGRVLRLPVPTEKAGTGNAQAGKIVAYCAAVFDGEPAYDRIEGRWLTAGDYVVVHRLAVAEEMKGQGVATQLMRHIEALARRQGAGSFRADTNFDNRCMLRLLEKLGFAYCGKIRYDSGERLAYEKALE